MKLQALYTLIRSNFSGNRYHLFATGFFWFLLLLSVFYIWSVPAYVTMDGPAHLYNASLFSFYGKSEFLRQYFTVNTFLLPNLLSHWLLVALLQVFPPLVAEKILLTLIAIFLPLSFRWSTAAIKNQTGSMLSFLIFPLLFSNLMHHGFYNFCVAFVFFNLSIGLISRISSKGQNSWKLNILFFLSMLGLVFSHAFVFAVALPFCFFFSPGRDKFSRAILLKVSLLMAPAIFVFIYFLSTITIPDYKYDWDASEKWLSLISFGPGIVFDAKNETGGSCLIFIVLMTLLTIFLMKRFQIMEWKKYDVFLLASLAFLYLIFHTTDGLFGGMFIQRLFYLVFYLLVFWLALENSCNPVLNLIVMIVVLYSFLGLANERKKVMLAVAPEIEAISEAGKRIKDQSVVQVNDKSSGWFRAHFSNYLGLGSQVVLSENYEAVLDWFPLHWKIDPKAISPSGQGKLRADYLFIYINPRLPGTADSIIGATMKHDAQLLYRSETGSCWLFENNQ